MKYIYLLIATITLLNCSCSDKGTNPDDELCKITDSTSHNFTWHTDTLGIWPSVLYDVSAIDENNVWAVGDIKLDNDSTYNAIKWNGNDFEYNRFKLDAYGGSNPLYQELRVALTFSNNDIWFFSLGSLMHWDGTDWKSQYIGPYLKGVITDAWGTSSTNFFLAGEHGSITHYNGTSFTLMESGTDVNLHDITGYVDPKTGLTHVWAAGSLTLLHYDGLQWQTVWDENNPLLPDNYNYAGALYAPNYKQLLIAAYRPVDEIGGFCINTKDPSDFKQVFTTDFYPYRMDGQAINDIFIVGSANGVAHFNGNSIRRYYETNSFSNRSVSYINNHVYIVGPLVEQLGLFVRGTRN